MGQDFLLKALTLWNPEMPGEGAFKKSAGQQPNGPRTPRNGHGLSTCSAGTVGPLRCGMLSAPRSFLGLACLTCLPLSLEQEGSFSGAYLGSSPHSLDTACLVSLMDQSSKRDLPEDTHVHLCGHLPFIFGALALGPALWKHLPLYVRSLLSSPKWPQERANPVLSIQGGGNRLTQLVRTGAGFLAGSSCFLP